MPGPRVEAEANASHSAYPPSQRDSAWAARVATAYEAWRVAAKRALGTFAVGVLGIAVVIASMQFKKEIVVGVIAGITTAIFAFGVIRAIIALRYMWRERSRVMPLWTAAVVVFPLLSGLFFTYFGMVFSFLLIVGLPRGI